MIAPQVGPVADLGGNLLKSGQQPVKPAQEPGWFASMLKSFSDGDKVVKPGENFGYSQNVNIDEGDVASNSDMQTSEEGEQHTSSQNGAHAKGVADVKQEDTLLNDVSVKQQGVFRGSESRLFPSGGLVTQTDVSKSASDTVHPDNSGVTLDQDGTARFSSESNGQTIKSDAPTSYLDRSELVTKDANGGSRTNGAIINPDVRSAAGNVNTEKHTATSVAHDSLGGSASGAPVIGGSASGAPVISYAAGADTATTAKTGNTNSSTQSGIANANMHLDAGIATTQTIATGDAELQTSVKVDPAIPPALDSNILTEANTEELKATGSGLAIPLQMLDARLTGAVIAPGRSPMGGVQPAIPVQHGMTAQSLSSDATKSPDMAVTADDLLMNKDGEIQAAPAANMQRAERHVAPGSDRNVSEFSNRLESAINTNNSGSSSGQGNPFDGRPFQNAAVPNSALTENIPSKAEIDSFKEALANSGLEMLRAVDNPADGFSRLSQVAVPHIGLRREVLPALQQIVKDVSESARTAPETWQKHNFVMDDGHRVDVMVRQVEGVMHLKLSASNPELSRLLEEYALEIEEHLKDTLAVAVDLQFGQGAADGQAMGTGFTDHRSKSPYSTSLSDLRRAKDAAELTKNAQNVRYFGYNSTEWTA